MEFLRTSLRALYEENFGESIRRNEQHYGVSVLTSSSPPNGP